ncbi:MAG: DUF484 family protein, partial [Thiohalorhabdus sp.]
PVPGTKHGMAQQTDQSDHVGHLRALLRENPTLFRDYPDLLEELELAPGEEASVVALEHARNRRLERRLGELKSELEKLVETARENDRLARQLHRLTVELLGCDDGHELVHALLEGVRQNFRVEAVGLRMAREWFAPNLDERFLAPQLWVQKRFVASSKVILGPPEDPEGVTGLYGETGEAVRSQALVPLRDGTQLFGLLGLGSSEADRYTSGMGTAYLERLAELAEALLARYARD